MKLQLGDLNQMKKLLTFLILTMVVLSACGSKSTESSSGNEESASKSTEEGQREQVASEVKLMEQVNLNEQYGGESFTKDGLNEDSIISDKDGITYIVTPDSFGNIYISVINGDKFIVKEKKITLHEKGLTDTGTDFELALNGNNLILLMKNISTTYNGYNLFSCHISEDGSLERTKVAEGVNKKWNLELIPGLKGSYLSNKMDDRTSIINDKGEEIYSYDQHNVGQLSNGKYENNFLDEDNGVLYLDFNEAVTTTPVAMDLNKKTMIWDEDGEQKNMGFPVDGGTHFIGNKKGFYLYHTNGKNGGDIYYYQNYNGEIGIMNQTYLNSSLEVDKYADSHLTLDDKYLNVYNRVMYQGQPTLQKYSYTRIDN